LKFAEDFDKLKKNMTESVPSRSAESPSPSTSSVSIPQETPSSDIDLSPSKHQKMEEKTHELEKPKEKPAPTISEEVLQAIQKIELGDSLVGESLSFPFVKLKKNQKQNKTKQIQLLRFPLVFVGCFEESSSER